jgi:hypothetical protein
MLPLIPVALGVGALYAWRKRKKTSGMTPEREAAFAKVLQTEREPHETLSTRLESMEAVAVEFEKAGFRSQAVEIRKRKAILGAPQETRAAWRSAFKKGIAQVVLSTEAELHKRKEQILSLAAAFHKQGHYGSAKELTDHAAGLTVTPPPSVHGPLAEPAEHMPEQQPDIDSSAVHGPELGQQAVSESAESIENVLAE